MTALDRDRMTRLASRNSRNLLPTFLWISTPVLLFVLLIVLASRVTDVPLYAYFQDPLTTTEGHPFLGAASSIGILLWCFGATVCVVGASLFKDRDYAKYRFFLTAGVLTSVLLVDDLLMVHERVASMYFGMSELPVLAAEAGGTAAFVTGFRRRIL